MSCVCAKKCWCSADDVEIALSVRVEQLEAAIVFIEHCVDEIDTDNLNGPQSGRIALGCSQALKRCHAVMEELNG